MFACLCVCLCVGSFVCLLECLFDCLLVLLLARSRICTLACLIVSRFDSFIVCVLRYLRVSMFFCARMLSSVVVCRLSCVFVCVSVPWVDILNAWLVVCLWVCAFVGLFACLQVR